MYDCLHCSNVWTILSLSLYSFNFLFVFHFFFATDWSFSLVSGSDVFVVVVVVVLDSLAECCSSSVVAFLISLMSGSVFLFLVDSAFLTKYVNWRRSIDRCIVIWDLLALHGLKFLKSQVSSEKIDTTSCAMETVYECDLRSWLGLDQVAPCHRDCCMICRFFVYSAGDAKLLTIACELSNLWVCYHLAVYVKLKCCFTGLDAVLRWCDCSDSVCELLRMFFVSDWCCCSDRLTLGIRCWAVSNSSWCSLSVSRGWWLTSGCMLRW